MNGTVQYAPCPRCGVTIVFAGGAPNSGHTCPPAPSMTAAWWNGHAAAEAVHTGRAQARRIRYAPHMRSRINSYPTQWGLRWRVELVNTALDSTIAADSPFRTLADATAYAEEWTGAARVAWMAGFGDDTLVGDGRSERADW